ncbi:three-Cys-motif partner protein TcmP [Bradyrhizobium sp. AZCC 1693]|uniref:three-Cys-motif partner protein TcmP n=1 Tax=Bradyrhizobium sp. AZCC 1693 TaxID=3117029 RepID=UPI002FF29452
MQPRTTIWELEPHTAAKHEILRRYIQAWAPILSQGNFPHLVFVDGFAGPGRYSEGEEGSPVIAAKAVINQLRPIKAKVDFHFIELDEKRSDHLATEIGLLTFPSNVSAKIHGGRAFQDTFPEVWDSYASRPGRSRPPTFVFIDPFGFKIPFSNVVKVLSAPSCEVLITFMFEEINRFLSQGQQPDNFDDLFGCRDWREGIDIKLPRERVKFLHDLYQRQLTQAAGARFVRSFAMRNERNTMDYFLFFATNNELGLKKIKEAMWRVDESGTYTFSDATDPNQSVLFSAEPNRELLKRLIVGKFEGTEVTASEIERFVVHETPFRETHYKKVLQTLEGAERLIPIDPPANRRRGTYADINMKLRFEPKT